MNKPLQSTCRSLGKHNLPMEPNEAGTKWGIFCGVAGGMSQYIAQINHPIFFEKIMEAIITAFLCGIAGAMGKHIYDIMKRKSKSK